MIMRVCFHAIIAISFSMLSMPRIRLWMMMICPPRASSALIAHAMMESFQRVTMVSIGFFLAGGVARMDIFLRPESARLSERGIGVAESDRISRLALIFLIFSLCVTQNLCSSSMMRSQSRFQVISSEMSLCVPTTTSTVPDFIASSVYRTSLGELMRVRTQTRTPNGASRAQNVS